MDGYLDDPVATDAVIDGEWLRTGDVAQLVDDEVVPVGRLKEMINRNGQRVAASDFELAVQGTEGVLPDRVVAFGDVGPDGERVVLLAESRYRSARAGAGRARAPVPAGRRRAARRRGPARPGGLHPPDHERQAPAGCRSGSLDGLSRGSRRTAPPRRGGGASRRG